MEKRAALRLEPVHCLITIHGGDGEDYQILEFVEQDCAISRETDIAREYFRVVHGSVIWVGDLPNGVTETATAVIIDLPTTRVSTTGTARVRMLANGQADIEIQAQDASNQEIAMRIRCRGATPARYPLREIS